MVLKLEAARVAALRMRDGIASEKVARLAEHLLCTTPTQPHVLIMRENRLIELTENEVLEACDRGGALGDLCRPAGLVYPPGAADRPGHFCA